MNLRIRPIAMYLPQFHPIPENDLWWGKGFTEWTNVVKAKPLFKDHYQPHLPADLGFYDLRVPEVREQQAQMARDCGIYGFCYYHYWFNGKKVLERPFQEVLKSGKPDFPFMLCWPNENWTRAWDGNDNDILLEQKYSEDDAYAHFTYLLPAFKDPRYIKVDGKPVFIVYRSANMPNAKMYFQVFRDEAAKENMQLYICHINHSEIFNKTLLNSPFDAIVDFQPFSPSIHEYVKNKGLESKLTNIPKRIKRKSLHLMNLLKRPEKISPKTKGFIDYAEYVDFVIKTYRYRKEDKMFPSVTPSWDNTARKGKDAFVLYNNEPKHYEKWLKHVIKEFEPFSEEENFVFINAWNEWGEGNHLEPCHKWGHTYLQATKKAIESI